MKNNHQLNNLIAVLDDIAKPVVDSLLPEQWIGDGYRYCPSCADKARTESKNKKNSSHDSEVIENGNEWSNDYDTVPFCASCDAYLDGHLSDSGVNEELEYYMKELSVKAPYINIDTPESAYELSCVLSAVSSDKQTAQALQLRPFIKIKTALLAGKTHA